MVLKNQKVPTISYSKIEAIQIIFETKAQIKVAQKIRSLAFLSHCKRVKQ